MFPDLFFVLMLQFFCVGHVSQEVCPPTPWTQAAYFFFDVHAFVFQVLVRLNVGRMYARTVQRSEAQAEPAASANIIIYNTRKRIKSPRRGCSPPWPDSAAYP